MSLDSLKNVLDRGICKSKFKKKNEATRVDKPICKNVLKRFGIINREVTDYINNRKSPNR